MPFEILFDPYSNYQSIPYTCKGINWLCLDKSCSKLPNKISVPVSGKFDLLSVTVLPPDTLVMT